MTNSLSFLPEATSQDEPVFWRDLLKITLSYMKWAYGALLASFVTYGLYLGSKGSREWSFGIDALELLALACTLWQLMRLKQRVAAYELFTKLSGFSRQSEGAVVPDGHFALKAALENPANRVALIELLDPNWVFPEGSKLSKDDLKELINLLEHVDPTKEAAPLVRQLWQVLELLKAR